ncbi:MAG TPA: hypothetical protein VGD65_25595 [Chryseosolibacter sp.]
MKRVVLLVILWILSGIGLSQLELPGKPQSPPRPRQCGYTIIEAGRALDCRGDTISIPKIHPEIMALQQE